MTERNITNSLEHPNLIDDSIVKIGLDDNKVMFRKGSNGEEDASKDNTTNKLSQPTNGITHTKQLLVVNGKGMNGRGSVSTR